jgi:hypothetical protein
VPEFPPALVAPGVPLGRSGLRIAVREVDNFSEGNGQAGSNYLQTSGISDGGALTLGATWVYDASLVVTGSAMGSRVDVSTGTANRFATMAGIPQDGIAAAFAVCTFMLQDWPTANNSTILNLRGLGIVQCGLVTTTTNKLVLRDKTTTRYTSTTTLVAGVIYTAEIAVDAVAQKMYMRLWDQNNVLLEQSGPQTYTLGGFVDTVNIGYITAPGLTTHLLVPYWGYSTLDWVGPPASLAAIVNTVRAATTTAPVAVESVTAALAALLQAPGRALLAAITGLRGPVVQNPAKSIKAQAVVATRAVTQTPARALKAAAAGTVLVVTSPARALGAAVAAARKATQTLAATVSNLQSRFQTLLVTQAPARTLAQAVAATRTVTQAPARTVKHAATAALAIVQAPARALRNAVAHVLTLLSGPGFALVQQAHWTGSSGAAQSAPLTTTAGNLLVVSVAVNTNVAITSVTDGAGNSYVRGDGNAANSRDIEIWYCPDALPLAAQRVTVNGAAFATTVVLSEYSGDITTQPDQHAAHQYLSTTTPAAENVTPAQPDDLVVSAITYGTPSGTTCTLSGGYTQLTSDANVAGGQSTAYLIGPAVGSPTAPTWTLSPARAGSQVTVAFRSAHGLNVLARVRSAILIFQTVAAPVTDGARLNHAVATARASIVVMTGRPVASAVAATRTAVQAPGRTLAQAVSRTWALLEAGLAKTSAAVAARQLVATAPGRALKASVAATRSIATTVGRTVSNGPGVALKATTTVGRTVKNALGVTSRATQGPVLRISMAALTATLRYVEAPVRNLLNQTASSINVRAVAALTARSIQAVTARRTTSTTTAGVWTTVVGQTFRIGQTVLLRRTAAVVAQLNAYVAPAYNLLAPSTYRAENLAEASFTNGTYVVTTTSPIDGATSFLGTASGAGDGLRISWPKLASAPPATPGDRWSARATVTNTSVAAQFVSVYVEFFRADNTYLTSSLIGTVSIPAGQSHTFAGNAVNLAPAQAVKAWLLVVAPNSPAGYTQLVDDVLLQGPSQGLRHAVRAVQRAATVLAAFLDQIKHAVFHPGDFAIRVLDDHALFTARAGGPVWTVSLTKGGRMHSQLAVSDEPVPVLVTSRFGLDPTGDIVNFQITERGAIRPTQAEINLPATWYTDTEGDHWAMCQCGPNSDFQPDPNTIMWLYLKIGDATQVVKGPVTVQFT